MLNSQTVSTMVTYLPCVKRFWPAQSLCQRNPKLSHQSISYSTLPVPSTFSHPFPNPKPAWHMVEFGLTTLFSFCAVRQLIFSYQYAEHTRWFVHSLFPIPLFFYLLPFMLLVRGVFIYDYYLSPEFTC